MTAGDLIETVLDYVHLSFKFGSIAVNLNSEELWLTKKPREVLES
jgi:hypothetical protein